MVDGDHDGRGDLAGQRVGGQVLEQLDERLAVAVRPVTVGRPEGIPGGGRDVRGRRWHLRPWRPWLPAGRTDEARRSAARSWPGSRRQGGQGEVPGGGAVAVVVPGQPRLGQRGVFLGAQHLVLVGVDLGLRTLRDRQDPPALLAQGAGVDELGPAHQVRLDRGPLVRLSPLGQLRGGGGDDLGVLGGHVSGGQRLAGGCETVVQCCRQSDVAGCLPALATGAGRQPRGRPGQPRFGRRSRTGRPRRPGTAAPPATG